MLRGSSILATPGLVPSVLMSTAVPTTTAAYAAPTMTYGAPMSYAAPTMSYAAPQMPSYVTAREWWVRMLRWFC